MTGWLLLVSLAIVTLVLLVWLGKLPRRTWEAVAAISMLGIAGYAVQGSPASNSVPAKPLDSDSKTAGALIDIRAEMDLEYRPGRGHLITADSFAREGDFKLAASFIKSGIREYPREADPWSALGLYLMLASEGRISPPAQYAFDRARKLNPRAPAPDYFQGLAALFEGRPREALKLWQDLLENAPKQAKWRKRIAGQVAGIEALMKQSENARSSKPATDPSAN